MEASPTAQNAAVPRTALSAPTINTTSTAVGSVPHALAYRTASLAKEQTTVLRASVLSTSSMEPNAKAAA